MGTEERWRDSQQGGGHVWDPGRGPGGGGVLVEMQAAGSPQTRAPEESAPCSQEGARLGEGRQFRA